MNALRLKNVLLLLLLVGAGAFSLYYGCAMLMVPASPREPDFLKFRVIYSLVPIAGALAFFVLAALVWRSTKKIGFIHALASVIMFSVALTIGVFVVLAVGAGFFNR